MKPKPQTKYAGLRVIEHGPGEWFAFHDGRGIMRAGATRTDALRRCHEAVLWSARKDDEPVKVTQMGERLFKATRGDKVAYGTTASLAKRRV